MKIKLLDPDCMPFKKHSFDGGWDLRANRDALIRPGETVKIGAGIAVEIPRGYVGDIRPRSSISAMGLILPIGTVDASYRGEIGIILINASNDAKRIEKGERIAQLVITPCLLPDLKVVEELPETERGSYGFGSTGRF